MGSSSGLAARASLLDTLVAAFPHTVPGLGREPNPALGIDPASLSREDFASWMGSGRFEAFADALAKAGHCANPIQLRGQSKRVDKATGEILSSYSSAEEPGGITYVPCGNRREDICPYCSRLYAGDTFQLLRAGIVGGKTVPEHVADNPLVFATFTAPSFGPVHTRAQGTGGCHPHIRGPERCPHDRPRRCSRRHTEDDEQLGQPLCADCYDYESHLVWNWWAPALFRRFTIALRRSLAKDLGIAATRFGEVATLQYAKVAEPQRRVAIHFHALIRLDGPRTHEGFAPAAATIDAQRLAWHVRRVAAQVRLEVRGVDDDDLRRVLRFGRQLDARPVTTRRRPDDPERDLAPEQVAGYLAKYITKSTGGEGAGNAHHRRLRTVGRSLAARARQAARAQTEDEDDEPPYARLGKWVHMYCFRGHFSSKSRRYSITLGALRRARRRARALLANAERTGTPVDLAAMEAELLADEDDTETTLVIGSWAFNGTGWADETERTLALASAALAREYDREKAAQRNNRKQSNSERKR